MSTATITRRPAQAGTGNGGVPARRAVIRWSLRLFRREWRQQLLVLALIIVAVGATVLGAAVSTNNPPPANAGFGTAQDQATFFAPDPQLASWADRVMFLREGRVTDQTAEPAGPESRLGR